MRIAIATIASALCFQAAAADRCPQGSLEPIVVAAWSAEAASETSIRLKLDLESRLLKDVRLIDAMGGFDDALGIYLGGYLAPPDVVLPADAKTTITMDVLASYFPRLLKIARDDVVPLFCTKAVVYSDGTKEAFD